LQNFGKVICMIILNGLFLITICLLGVYGIPFAILYTLILILLVGIYMPKIRNWHDKLLQYMQYMSEGNINFERTEKLGYFESFGVELDHIKDHVNQVVKEEMASQQMKAELITNVSHDLKTPLTTIITYTDLLKNENLDQKTRKQYVEVLERKSLHLKRLIEDLFEISKANSNSIKLDKSTLDLFALVKQVGFEMEEKWNASNLQIRYQFPDERAMVFLDGQKTFRIFENLFGNIAKYSLEGSRVYIEGTKEDGFAKVILKNITKEELTIDPKLLTERFTRGDKSRNTEGSGLGLAIAKSFTEIQGGNLDITCDSDLFKVTIKFLLQ